MRRLRVYFTGEIFRAQPRGGISRLFVEIAARLPEVGVDPVFIVPLVTNQHLAGARIGNYGVALPPRLRRLTGVAWRLSRAIDHVAARALPSDLVHETYYSFHTPGRTPTVCTVYDMIPELYPDEFPQGNPHAGKREAASRARLIVAISESTKRDLVKWMGPSSTPIRVVPLAADTERFRSLARGAGPREPVILFVGQRATYKNFRRFAESAARILARRPEQRLVCIGGGPFKPGELDPFATRGVADRVTQRSADDAGLAQAYATAGVFVFPSLYEGFGLPALEAFALSTPVVLSNRGSLPEVAEDAADYFDPESEDSIEAAIDRMVGDAGRRREMGERGRRRAGAFSWERSARVLAEAYREVAG